MASSPNRMPQCYGTEVDGLNFYPDHALRIIAEDMEKQSGFRIDATSKNNLWGQLRIQDIEQDAEVIESIDIRGFYGRYCSNQS